MVIYGQSLGGHLSAVVAAQRQNDIDGLVIEGAFSSHKDIAANIAGIFGRIFVNEKYSAVKSIKDYKKPLLVIHSTEDKIIPFKMGQKIFDNANSPKEFFEIKKEHILGPKFYTDEISKKIKSMCTANWMDKKETLVVTAPKNFYLDLITVTLNILNMEIIVP